MQENLAQAASGQRLEGPTRLPPLTMAAIKQEEFRLFLQGELVRRCQSNGRYSLRAFARTLDIEPSALSKLLNGKRQLTPEMFARLTGRLALGHDDVRHFIRTDDPSQQPQMTFDQISLDSFQVVSDWYHMAIVELGRVRGFRGDPQWVARALGISSAEARDAIDRLIRLGLLAQTAKGTFCSTGKEVTTVDHQFTTAALKKMQRQVLERAIQALEDTPVEKRDQSTMTMAVDTARLPAAKLKIREFRRSLCDFLEGSSKRSEVYHLSISLYPVTNIGGLK